MTNDNDNDRDRVSAKKAGSPSRQELDTISRATGDYYRERANRLRNQGWWNIFVRYVIISAIILLLCGIIVKCEYNTTVRDVQKWRDKANVELLREDTIYPVRGDILAADGSVLATNLCFYDVRIDMRPGAFRRKDFLKAIDSLSDSLAKYHPVRTSDEWKALLRAEAARKPDAIKRPLTLLRNVTYFDKERLRNTFPFFHRWRNRSKTGLVVDESVRRAYPYGDMARRSIGRVGRTKECDEVHGNSGLEKALDSLLYGIPGRYKKVPLTHGITNWTDIPAVNGYSLLTTIDVGIQDIVDHELNSVLEQTGAQWGTAILMEANTGDIKAISNLELDTLSGRYVEAMYRVLQGFEPGSVMKTLSMTIALEDGFVTNLDQTYPIGHSYAYGGGPAINDTHSPATLPVRRFLEYSSNIGMTKLVAPHFARDPNGFRERLRQMGFLDRFNTGIAGEEVPYFPRLDLKAGGLVSLSRQTYGYGSRIPPLYMCAFYNAIASGGRFVRPRIVKAIRRDNGTDSVLPVTYVRDRICSEEHASMILDMLHEVIYGKGGTARMLKDDKVVICGKTGTAKIAYEITPEERERSRKAMKAARTHEDSIAARPRVKPGYINGKYRLAFCGIIPYKNPRYTCMVLISDPGPAFRSAGNTSGIVVLNVARKLYSRGLLGNGSDFHVNPDGSSVTPQGATPVIYAGMNGNRRSALGNALGTDRTRTLRTPRTVSKGLPDVRGLSVRDALTRLEKAGYTVSVRGSGFVSRQSPAPGTAVRRGGRVVLYLDRYDPRPKAVAPDSTATVKPAS